MTARGLRAATVLMALALGGGAQAQQGTRFAVVDVDPKAENEALRTNVEREILRLRPGIAPIEEAGMRRLLLTGEGPGDAAKRTLREALDAGRNGDCEAAASKGKEAEAMLLAALSIDEERDLLKSLYTTLVICEAKRNRPAELALAAARLRTLVAMAPTDLPAPLWEKHVAQAGFGPETTEMVVDSEPANATAAVNLRGAGVTPHTLKVPKGTVFVELQKEGYKKAFRAVQVTDRPARVVMRLIPRAQDRTEQTEAQLRLLRQTELKNEVAALSRLSQLVRVETLVLLQTKGDKVTISFFDAERGALTEAPIESRYDARTGRVEALAARETPGKGAAPIGSAPDRPAPPDEAGKKDGEARPSATAPLPSGAPPASEAAPPLVPGSAGLPEAQSTKQQAQYVPRKKKEGAPWWSWLIAGAVGAGFLAFMYSDRPQTSETIKVRASFTPPP